MAALNDTLHYHTAAAVAVEEAGVEVHSALHMIADYTNTQRPAVALEVAEGTLTTTTTAQVFVSGLKNSATPTMQGSHMGRSAVHHHSTSTKTVLGAVVVAVRTTTTLAAAEVEGKSIHYSHTAVTTVEEGNYRLRAVAGVEEGEGEEHHNPGVWVVDTAIDTQDIVVSVVAVEEVAARTGTAVGEEADRVAAGAEADAGVVGTDAAAEVVEENCTDKNSVVG